MLDPTFILFVSDLDTSIGFYSRLLNLTPVPFEPTFVMFFLESGARLGLLAVPADKASTPAPSAGFELDFPVGENADVDRLHKEWSQQGITITRPPHDMSFAYTFVASDPDGHCLRVYCRRVSG